MESEAIILALAALAQSTRLDAFRLPVRHEPKGLAAGNIAKAVAVPQSTMSSHLALLSRAGLVSARRSSRSTGAILVVLIAVFEPISGAHFNPAVTLVFRLGGELSTSDALMYSLVQIIGGIIGTMIAHLMFGLPLLNEAMKIRTGGAQWFAEAVASFGLIVTILAGLRFERGSVAGWPLYHSRVLVYGIDVVCQSSRRSSAFADEHVFRDPSAGPPRFCHGRILWGYHRCDWLAAARG